MNVLMLELVRRRYILRNVILITVILIVLTWIPKSNGQVPQRKGDSQKQEATEERQTYESDKNVQVRNGTNKKGHANSKVNEITSELTDTEIKGGDKTNDEEKEKEGKGKSEFRCKSSMLKNTSFAERRQRNPTSLKYLMKQHKLYRTLQPEISIS